MGLMTRQLIAYTERRLFINVTVFQRKLALHLAIINLYGQRHVKQNKGLFEWFVNGMLNLICTVKFSKLGQELIKCFNLRFKI